MEVPITGISVCAKTKVLPYVGYEDGAAYIQANWDIVLCYVPAVGTLSLDFPSIALMRVDLHGTRTVIGWVPKSQAEKYIRLLGMDKPTPCKIKRSTRSNENLQYLIVTTDVRQKTNTPLNSEKSKMARIPSIQNVIQDNIRSATAASKLEIGHVASRQMAKIVGRRLPEQYALLLQSPVGALVLANATTYLAQAFQPNNKMLEEIAKAMSVDAYQQIIKEFDIPGMLEELLSNKDVAAAFTVETPKE